MLVLTYSHSKNLPVLSSSVELSHSSTLAASPFSEGLLQLIPSPFTLQKKLASPFLLLPSQLFPGPVLILFTYLLIFKILHILALGTPIQSQAELYSGLYGLSLYFCLLLQSLCSNSSEFQLLSSSVFHQEFILLLKIPSLHYNHCRKPTSPTTALQCGD